MKPLKIIIFIFFQVKFIGKRILELGAGTALPGLLAAKLGASKVILTDSLHLPHCINNCEEGVQLNDLKVGERAGTNYHYCRSFFRRILFQTPFLML